MYKVKNAIILAAGRGSRLKKLTENTPKPLLAPRGVKFIDGIIKNLRVKGINNIYIVTGYLSEQFNYLENQGISLIYNKEWNKGNNITSVKAAINVIDNSLIINGDIIMKENVFQTEYKSSLTYVEKNEYIDEWITIFDENENVVDFEKNGINKKGFFQREIIFVSSNLAKEIKKDILDFDMQEYQEYLMLKTSKRTSIPFKHFEISKGIIFDLDSLEAYNEYANFTKQ